MRIVLESGHFFLLKDFRLFGCGYLLTFRKRLDLDPNGYFWGQKRNVEFSMTHRFMSEKCIYLRFFWENVILPFVIMISMAVKSQILYLILDNRKFTSLQIIESFLCYGSLLCKMQFHCKFFRPSTKWVTTPQVSLF